MPLLPPFTIRPVVNLSIHVIEVSPSPIVKILQGIEQAAPLPEDSAAYAQYHQTVRALIQAGALDLE